MSLHQVTYSILSTPGELSVSSSVTSFSEIVMSSIVRGVYSVTELTDILSGGMQRVESVENRGEAFLVSSVSI